MCLPLTSCFSEKDFKYLGTHGESLIYILPHRFMEFMNMTLESNKCMTDYPCRAFMDTSKKNFAFLAFFRHFE